ncbi:glyoxylate/hydroxypyruvate reductase A [Aliifodinibius sp. S!AR15-10]|uniref:2-hydroxyacid dehydrogenase n=1 Tax=Aliifodinibius sp. S!AR15-10 TaxID=2950437 RepID=UPI0028655498|nr:glyoxylate/hydroxypyruvate reductase A [Aliifodinibius sp. S!AR15-10]MDR8391665.1 glyoxylate/hydroxypyruvate reductase A [Aliifodinibius sp. S!AR15-10]
MSLLLLAPHRNNMQTWKEALLEEDPNLDVEIWSDVEDKERVQFIVSWNQPKRTLNQFPNLKVVSSLGTGVDHILRDEHLPENVSVCRVVSSSLVRQMQEYVLMAVLDYQRNLHTYFRQRSEREWREHPNKTIDEIPVGVMGLGKLGAPVAQMLAKNGYQVAGWSYSKKELDGIETFVYDELEQFLKTTRILVCLLPLTSETHGILDLDLFKKLEHPAYLINVARGEHLVDEDLIYALETGWIEGACLDVFSEEPLPDRHPFWNRKQIMITPHAASFTPPHEVAEQVVENYKRALSGMELLNEVDLEKGY